MTVIESSTVDVDLQPTRPEKTRHEFYRQIARLEYEVSSTMTTLDPSRRPKPDEPRGEKPHLLSDRELEASRDALVARLGEVEDLVVQQSIDHAEARTLLKRMNEAPEHYRWISVTTKETGDEGCRTWQSVPVLGPIGILGNWWRIRMSSGCP